MTPRLIQTQSPAPHLSVSVWREVVAAGKSASEQYQYRKIWKDDKAQSDSTWLSWAHHEHLMLSLLSQRSIAHVVKVSGLQVADHQVELVTLDAGPDFLRDWLLPSQQAGKPTLWRTETDALKWLLSCLNALLSLHRMGVIHGDLKADNLCVSEHAGHRGSSRRLNLNSLTMIDFAYALYREAPLKCVLPTDPDRLDYLPDFYRQAIQASQAAQDPAVLLSVACANIDLYSLGCLMEQTVDPTVSHSWRSWSDMQKAIRRIGCKQQKTYSFWGNPTFDQPTRSLIREVESVLQRLNVPRDQWDWADTVTPAQAAVTPLMVEPTPLIALTPLISREVMVIPANPVVPVATELPPAVAPVFHPVRPAMRSTVVLAQYPRLFTLAGLALDATIFELIDRAYVVQALVLSNAAYACGLLSVVTGFLIAMQTLRIVFKPNNQALLWWTLLQAVLICAAFFFVTTLQLSIQNAAAVSLLAIQVWIWIRVRKITKRRDSIV